MIYGWAVVHNTGRMILNCSQAQFKMPVFVHLWIQMYFFFGGWRFHFFRRVLEMCCFMEKMLANMLADFEMKVEKAVLEPLNKLSEVRVTPLTHC